LIDAFPEDCIAIGIEVTDEVRIRGALRDYRPFDQALRLHTLSETIPTKDIVQIVIGTCDGELLDKLHHVHDSANTLELIKWYLDEIYTWVYPLVQTLQSRLTNSTGSLPSGIGKRDLPISFTILRKQLHFASNYGMVMIIKDMTKECMGDRFQRRRQRSPATLVGDI